MIITPLYGFQQIFRERLEKRYWNMWLLDTTQPRLLYQVHDVLHAAAVGGYRLHHVPHDPTVTKQAIICNSVPDDCVQVLHAADGRDTHGLEQRGLHIHHLYGKDFDFVNKIFLFIDQTTSKPGKKGLLPLCMLSLYCTMFTIIYSIWTHPIVHQVIHLD